MPARIAVHLEPRALHGGGLWDDTGPAAGASVLRALGGRYGRLASALHDGRYERLPYSVSPVIRGRAASGGQVFRILIGVAIRAGGPDRSDGREHRVVTTPCDADDEVLFAEAVATRMRDAGELEIGRSRLTVAGADIHHLRVEELHGARPAECWRVTLFTGATVRTGRPSRRNRPLALPEHGLVSLARDLLHVSPAGLLPDDLPELVAERLEVVEFDLHDVSQLAHRGEETGVRGSFSVRLALGRGDAAMIRPFSTLLRFAPYLGLGDRRTIGWGCCATEPHSL